MLISHVHSHRHGLTGHGSTDLANMAPSAYCSDTTTDIVKNQCIGVRAQSLEYLLYSV